MAWGEQLPSGRWRGRYRVGGKTYILERDDGSPWTFTSKAAAKREAAAKETNMRQPGAVLPGSGRITWGEWRETWWPKHRKTIEANSIATYESKIENFLKPRWDSEPLDQIDRDAVQAWVANMPPSLASALDDAPAPASVHLIYNLFGASMRAAAVAKRISGTPCVNIDLPVIPPPDIHFLTRQEFDTLLPFLAGTWRMLALLCIGTGMRWGECVALHWQDVHDTTITIRQAYSWRGRHVKPFPKSKKPRVVPLPAWLAAELAAWRASLPSVSRCATPHVLGHCRSGLVIPHEAGGCLPYTTCNQTFRGAVELARIGRTTIHDLRDTYASWLLQSRQVTIEQIAELLGHADINLTRSRYAQFGSSQFDHIAAVLAAPGGVSAPILPQAAGAEIVDLDSRRRSEAG